MSDLSSTKVLIIGYGNSLRGDDGIGGRVAETIAQEGWPGVRALVCHQLTPELVVEMIEARAVIFVDAVSSNKSIVEIHSLQPIEMEGTLGHTSDPRSLLCFCQSLYGYCPAAWWVLIPGSHFEFGEQFSTVTEECGQNAINLIQQLILSMGQTEW